MYQNSKIKQVLQGLLIMSFVAFLAGCSEPVDESEDVIRPVKLFKVQNGTGNDLRQFPAEVSASEEAEISFRIPGELVQFPIKQAEEVSKGQLLARLDDRDIRNEIAARQADYDLAQTNHRRLKALYEKKSVSRSDLDNAEARLKSASAALQLAKDKLEYSELTAPFDGRIAQTQVENYQFVQAQQTVLVLQGNNTLDVSIQVPENIVSQVRKNQIDPNYHPVVWFSGNTQKEFKVSYKEHATRVTPGTQSYEVTFSLPIPTELTVYPGMGATLVMDMNQIIVNRGSVEFIVPLGAVLADDATGKQQVWVFDETNGRVNPVDVTVGRITQSGVSITSGLKEGDNIVSAGLNQLHQGMVVKPLQRERGL